MKLLDMESMKEIHAYQIGEKVFHTKEECNEYVKEYNLQQILKECFTHCIHAESMTPYFLEQFAKEVSKKKEEIKKWL